MTTRYKNASVVFAILLCVLTACNLQITNEKVVDSINSMSQWVDPQMNFAGAEIEQTTLKDSAMNDLSITQKIKEKNLSGLGLKSMIINVKTTQGMVTLHGKLDTRDQVIMAGTIASEVTGVKGVRNKLITQ
jgi:hyperosmotically inducible protein